MFVCPQKRVSSESQNVRTTQKDFCWNEFNIKVILITLPPTLDIWLHWYTAWKNKGFSKIPMYCLFNMKKGKPNLSAKYMNYNKFNSRSKVCMNHRLLLLIQYRLVQMHLFILHPLVFPLIRNQNYFKMCECGEEYLWLKIISF